VVAAAGVPQVEPASSIRQAFFHLVAKDRTNARHLFLAGEGQICGAFHWLPREQALLLARNQQLIWGSAAQVIVL
jgi:hypothetical protein